MALLIMLAYSNALGCAYIIYDDLTAYKFKLIQQRIHVMHIMIGIFCLC